MNIDQYLDNPWIAVTGRMSRFVRNPEGGTMPISCTVFDLNTLKDTSTYSHLLTLFSAFKFTALALKYGAGVKIQLGNYVPMEKPKDLSLAWQWYLHPGHPDWHVVKSRELPKYLKTTQRETLDLATIDRTKYRVITVEDSLGDSSEGVSIANSWLDFMAALLDGYIPVVDLSKLRPCGTVNNAGMAATGVFGDGAELDSRLLDSGSFLAIYWRLFNYFKNPSMPTVLQIFGQLNKTIHRGGIVKSGIVCTGMDYRNPLIKKYLNTSLAGLSGNQKKAVRIDEGILLDEHTELRQLLVKKVNEESVFLEKIQEPDSEGQMLFSNVCVEILQRHRGTCLLSHLNAGQIDKPEELIEAIPLVTNFVYTVHSTWRNQVSPQKSSLFISQEEDNQIGVGVVGWANFLAHVKVTYKEHIASLRNIVNIAKNLTDKSHILDPREYPLLTPADKISYSLYWGYYKAAKALKGTGIERAFTMAPTQSVAYRYKDLSGNTLSRAIDPPVSRRVRRSSEREKTKWVFHGKTIETAKDITPREHQEHWELWQELMEIASMHALGYSLAHSMSFDLWDYIDESNWLLDFLKNSPLKTTYYNFAGSIDQSYLNKGLIPTVEMQSHAVPPKDMYCNLEQGFCSTCAE